MTLTSLEDMVAVHAVAIVCLVYVTVFLAVVLWTLRSIKRYLKPRK